MKDYYSILGVPISATAEEIRRAFRQLALQYHPDVNNSPEATDRFQEISVAYQTLVNPEKRAEYDAARRSAASRSPAPQSPEQEPARRSYFQRRVRAATDPGSIWSYYDILGIPRDASEEDIVRSYQRLYREFYHGSDVDPGTAAILREIIDAREVLTDPDRRLAYDNLPPDRQPPGRPRHQPPVPGRNRRASGGTGAEGKKGCLFGLLLTPLIALGVLFKRLTVS